MPPTAGMDAPTSGPTPTVRLDESRLVDVGSALALAPRDIEHDLNVALASRSPVARPAPITVLGARKRSPSRRRQSPSQLLVKSIVFTALKSPSIREALESALTLRRSNCAWPPP